MTNINTVNNQNDNKFHNFAIGTAGAVIGYEAEPYIKRGLLYPVRKKIGTEIKTIQGGGFKPYIEKALKQNGLEKLNVIDLNINNAKAVKKQLGLTDIKSNTTSMIIYHLMRLHNNITNSFNRTINGTNAFFSHKHNAVVCNFDKFGAPIFHEIGHKLNSQSKNFFVKTLSKIRNPLAVFGTVGVSATAMLTNSKEKREKPKNIFDKTINFVKDNCGLVATAMMLPKTIEEIIASIKGGKIAKEAGLTGDLLKKVQKAHKFSMASYITGALATGLGVYLASQLRDYICSFKKESIE